MFVMVIMISLLKEECATQAVNELQNLDTKVLRHGSVSRGGLAEVVESGSGKSAESR